jgi:hypothetical protein
MSVCPWCFANRPGVEGYRPDINARCAHPFHDPNAPEPISRPAPNVSVQDPDLAEKLQWMFRFFGAIYFDTSTPMHTAADIDQFLTEVWDVDVHAYKPEWSTG